MAGKQNISSSSSCNSDSDHEDPDYTARLPQGNEAEKGHHRTGSTSTLRAKRLCAPEKNDNKQGEGPLNITLKLLSVERINFGRKRSPMYRRRNRKFKNDLGKGNKILMSKRATSSENQKKATIFSWLMDSRVIEENEEVFFKDEYNQNVIKEGRMRRGGVLCACCQKIFTGESFVLHGARRSNKPYALIFSSKQQIPLLSCMINAWNKPDNRERCRFNDIETKGNANDRYDDACMICADGGDLMCCEYCNSTYHQLCVDLKDVPRGSWYCPYCICKFCGDRAWENDWLLKCPQCEKRYHWECHRMRDKIIDLNSVPCAPFCDRSCKEIHDKLEKNMVGMKHELEEGFSWSLLHCMNSDTGIYIEDSYRRTLCHSKLAVALGLMEDCFEPIVDRYTRISVIPSVVYNCGSNFNRIHFGGFYTAILEKDEEIISVATLRIHGTNLAEMPFITTSEMHRRKGMCKKLMEAIESALCYLKVENLIIPSTSKMISNWIEKYGFQFLGKAVNKEVITHNTLMFHDSKRLQKTLVSPHLAKSDNSSEISLANTGSNYHQNWLSYMHKATITSIFGLGSSDSMME